MILWAVLTVMIAVAASALTVPLVRRHERRPHHGPADVLRAQLRELEGQVASGLATETEAEPLRTEIKRRLLAESRNPKDLERPVTKASSALFAMGIAGFVGVGATVLYAFVGSPEVPSAVGAAPTPGQQANTASAAQLAPLVPQLEAKMRAHPGDPKGWGLLGWSYMQTGRPGEAATAYARASTLAPSNPEYLSWQGEALTEAAEGVVSPAAVIAFRRALSLDPSNPRARYFLAAYKDQQGDHAGAVADWLALLRSAPPDAPWSAEVRSAIERVARQNRIDVSGMQQRRTVAPAG